MFVSLAFVVYISRRFRGELKVNENEGYQLRFFELNKLPLDISSPDKPIIDKYLSTIK